MEAANDKEQIAVVPLGREYSSSDFQLLLALESHLTREADSAPVGLVIDLGETVYMGCGLLSVLLRCSARLNEGKRRFAMCTLNALSENVLAVTQLDSKWEVFPTRADAVQAMRRPLHNEDAVKDSRLQVRNDAISRDG